MLLTTDFAVPDVVSFEIRTKGLLAFRQLRATVHLKFTVKEER